MQWKTPEYAIVGMHPDCHKMISDRKVNMDYEVVATDIIPPRCLVRVPDLKYP
jgi:hypothetical protein